MLWFKRSSKCWVWTGFQPSYDCSYFSTKVGLILHKFFNGIAGCFIFSWKWTKLFFFNIVWKMAWIWFVCTLISTFAIFRSMWALIFVIITKLVNLKKREKSEAYQQKNYVAQLETDVHLQASTIVFIINIAFKVLLFFVSLVFFLLRSRRIFVWKHLLSRNIVT